MAGPLIALTTDFGTGSSYVAQLKGVLLEALPEARLLDVSHDVPPQSIRHAEVLLRDVAFALPVGTVHVVVIDPGVGTARRGIAVASRGMHFVGPDNGVLGVALAQPGAQAVVLDRPELFRRPLSATFHGRDVFAPVAAELAGGLDLLDVGSPIDDALPSTLPACEERDGAWCGETLVADHFGNLLTNIPAGPLGEHYSVTVQGRSLRRVPTYGEAPAGEVVALVGSEGYVELAVRDGSAQRVLGQEAGLPVVCRAEKVL